jgi:hypothetical protein
VFVAPGQDTVAFGDLFIADWLYDGHLRQGSVPLRKIQPAPKGQEMAFAPARQSAEDWLLSYGQSSPAVIVDDDCHIDGVLEGRADGSIGGRLHFIAIRPANQAEMEMTDHFSLLPWHDPLEGVLPRKGFKQVVIDFNRRLSVNIKDGDEAEHFKALRVACPTPEGRSELLVRWSASSTRRGPMVAADASDKLARLLDEHGYDNGKAAARTLGTLLGSNWELEGGVEDAIGDAAEHRHDPEQLLDQIGKAYDEIEHRLSTARKAMKATRHSAPARG